MKRDRLYTLTYFVEATIDRELTWPGLNFIEMNSIKNSHKNVILKRFQPEYR